MGNVCISSVTIPTNVTMALYNSMGLVHLEYSFQFWSSQMTDAVEQEEVKSKATKESSD